MRCRFFFLLFPLAIFLMVLASIVTVALVKPGVGKSHAPTKEYAVRIEAPDSAAARFWITEGKGAPSEREPLVLIKDPGVVRFNETYNLAGDAGAARIEYEATLEPGDAAGLEAWLDFEWQNAALLKTQDRDWLAGAMDFPSGTEAELMAESLMGWSLVPAPVKREPLNTPLWLQEDLRVLTRAVLRDVVRPGDAPLEAAEIERLLSERFPPEIVRFRVYSVEPAAAGNPAGA